MNRLLLISALTLLFLGLNACGQVDVSLLEPDQGIQKPTNTPHPEEGFDAPADGGLPVDLGSGQRTGDDPGTNEGNNLPIQNEQFQPSLTADPIPVDLPDNVPNEVSKPAPTSTRQAEEPTCVVRNDWPTYQVKSGDTLGLIARWTGSKVATLAQANCLINPDLLRVGQILRVPRPIPDIPTPALLPSPTSPPSPTPVSWISYKDPVYEVSFSYPENWVYAGEESSTKFAGNDGFVQLEGIGAPYEINRVTEDQAYHKLLPYGSSPTIEPFTLSDGREARFIFPSADQPPGMNNQALLIAPYAEPIPVGQATINYLALAADVEHIHRITGSLDMPPWPEDIGIHTFDAVAVTLPEGGRRITFTWESYGATRGIIVSGTAQRFAPWWPVEASGELIVDLSSTIFPDPKMTLQVDNDVTGQQATEVLVINWPCAHEYFFVPPPERCPREAAVVAAGAFQSFEGGFMIWILQPGTAYPSIYVFEASGRVTHYPDTWTPGEPESDPEIKPPEGKFQPVRGFGKVWREYPSVREALGWGLAPEENYEVSYQGEIRESIPGVNYLTRPDGAILQLMDIQWRVFTGS